MQHLRQGVIDPIEKASLIKKVLSENIYGQEHAIEAVVDSIKNKLLDSENMPQHTFFFLGPPATGKTHMAKLISEVFSDYKFLSINMGDYNSKNDGQRLFGTEKGYSTEQHGMLTTHVKNNPKSLILFDEFEKAHTSIQMRLLSIFSEGHLSDSLGWLYNRKMQTYISYSSTDMDHTSRIADLKTKVDFTDTIVIFTSNLGKSLYTNQEFLDSIDNDQYHAESMIVQALLNETKRESDENVPAILPEMISRLSQGALVLFNKLNIQDLREIVSKEFKKKFAVLMSTYDVKIKIHYRGNGFLHAQLLRFAPELDVRKIKAKIYEQFTDKLTDHMLENGLRWKDINNIELYVDPIVEQYIRKNTAVHLRKGSLFKHLLRKNLTLSLFDKITYEPKDKSLQYRLEGVEFSTLQKPHDMIGLGAISFKVPTVSFDDVKGHVDVIDRLKEIAVLLKEPKKMKKFDATLPKGMLLYGKPGTGKTMLAKAFANFAELPFIETTANDLIDFSKNDFSTMKQVFERAKEYSPCIVFIDEIDTFGSRKNGSLTSMVNEMLTQINNISNNIDEAVFIIAATNYKDRIDEAMLRAGRIDLHVEIPSLDVEGRRVFIEQMLSKPSEENIDIEKLVRFSSGMTGAQLAKVANESALSIIRHQLPELTEECIIEQINIEKYGHKILNASVESELIQTAYHEAAHVVVGHTLMPEMEVEQITITPRTNSLGFVAYIKENKLKNLSKKDIVGHICISLAGRIAQVKKFGEDGIDTGASSDFNSATQLAYKLIKYFGMDESFGPINLIDIDTSDAYKYEIDKHVQNMLKKLNEQTASIVDNNWKTIEKVAGLLLKKEVLHKDELIEII